MTGQELRLWRQHFDLTQEMLAAALGLTVRAIGHYEAGSRTIPRVVELALEEVRRRASKRRRAGIRRKV